MANKAKENMKAYDKKRSNAQKYTEGQYVLIEAHTKSDKKKLRCGKLEPKFRGPYVVVRPLTTLNYELRNLHKPEKDTIIVHVEQMKPYHV
jgi:hypothetical protein